MDVVSEDGEVQEDNIENDVQYLKERASLIQNQMKRELNELQARLDEIQRREIVVKRRTSNASEGALSPKPAKAKPKTKTYRSVCITSTLLGFF